MKLCRTMLKTNYVTGEKESVVVRDGEDVEWEEFVDQPYEAMFYTTETICQPHKEVPYGKCIEKIQVHQVECFQFKV